MIESILWRRIDFPGHEICQLAAQDNGWTLTGTAVLNFNNMPCKLNYRILTDQSWQTISVNVDGQIGSNEVQVQIKHKEGRWSVNEQECPEVADCVDIDLGFSPSTNLLPIRRLSMSVGEQAKVRAAWLHFPSLELRLLEQEYKRESETAYRYESRGGEFVRRLEVRSSGFVERYPDFWEMEAAV